MADDGVTLALLNAKLDTVIEKVTGLRADQDDTDKRLRCVERDQARLQERVGLVAGALGILQLIMSAIAAAIGASK